MSFDYSKYVARRDEGKPVDSNSLPKTENPVEKPYITGAGLVATDAKGNPLHPDNVDQQANQYQQAMTKYRADVGFANQYRQDQQKLIKSAHISGALRDGYQFGDFIKTFGGTMGDMLTSGAEGFMKSFEGVVDVGYLGAGKLMDWAGAEGASDWLKDAAQTDVSGNIMAKPKSWFEPYSGMGNRGDKIAKGVGQVLGLKGMATGVANIFGGAGAGAGGTLLSTAPSAASEVASTAPAFLSSMGNAMEEAYASGATDQEAWSYGLMQGAVDAFSESLFGGLGKGANALGYGYGLTDLDDMVAKKAAAQFNSQFMKTMAEYGVKAGAEGLEEVAAGLGSAVAKKLSYQSEEDLKKLIADEDLMEQFISGCVISGLMQSGDVITSLKEGTITETPTFDVESMDPGIDFSKVEVDAAGVQNIADRLAPLPTAMQQISVNGTVSNRVADMILSDNNATQQLQQMTGAQFTGTKAEQRAQVKAAVEQIAKQQAAEAARQQSQAKELTEQEKAAANFDAAVRELVGVEDTKVAETEKPTSAEVKSESVQEQAEDAEAKEVPPAKTELATDTETESVGAAPAGFTGWKTEYYDQLTDDNAQPDRPLTDARPMEILKKDKEGRKVSEAAANLYSSAVTSDEVADRIQKMVNDGEFSYDPTTNKEALTKAAEKIAASSPDTVRQEIKKNVEKGKVKDGDIEKALLLYEHYASSKAADSQDIAADLALDLANMARMTGRNLQLFKLLRKMTPEGQLWTVEKGLQRYTQKLNRNRSDRNKQADVAIPMELRDAYLEAAEKDLKKKTEETEQAKAAAEEEIKKYYASQLDATMMEKLDAWRYMAMLGNVKTQARNIGGNLAFRPMVTIKRNIGAAIESVTLDQENRTKAMLGVDKEARALREWARADAKTVDARSLMAGSLKAGDEISTEIDGLRQIYDNKYLEAARTFIKAVPEVTDSFFKNWEYEVSLASFMKARGYTSTQLTAGDVPANVLQEGRQYAALEAMKATFNDINAFSSLMANLKLKGDSDLVRAINILGEGAMPFRRTPANIAVRAFEYSPVGLVRGLTNAAVNVKRGKVSAATAIDQIAAGITGTGVMGLGWLLARLGILTGLEDDEDEKNAGKQSYALNIGGKSYSIDWLAPANIPLFVGANAYSNKRDQDAGWFANLLDTFSSIIDPMMELSCLSSLKEVVQNVQYAEGNTWIAPLVASMAASYMNQFIPTLFGQLEQTLEPEKTENYTTATTGVGRVVQRALASATRKIPGIDLYQTEKLDQWGQPIDRGNFFERALDSLQNPHTTTEISTNPIDKEILRLNDAQTKDVTNRGPDKKLSYTDKEGVKHSNYQLTEEEWTTMREVYGKTAAEVLGQVIEADWYKDLTDEQKAQAFQYAYDYAREKGRIAALSGYPGYSDSWMEKAGDNVVDAIYTKTTSAAVNTAISKMEGAFKYGKPTTEATEALQQAHGIYSNMSATQKKSLLESLAGAEKYALQAMDAGLTAKEWADTYRLIYALTPEEGRANVRDVQKVEAVAGNSDLSDAEQAAVMKIYLSDAQDAKLDRIVAAGYDPELYAILYRADLDTTGGKDAVVRALVREHGLSLAAAKRLYSIYSS